MYSPFCSTTICHLSDNFRIPSSQSFFFLSKVHFRCLLQSSRKLKCFPLREFCKDRNKWKSEGSMSDNCGLSKAGIKIARRNINNLRYADDTTLMAESEEELKSLLMKVKVESGKSWLKAQHSENKDHGIRSHHFMGNRWGNSGNSVRLYFWGLQNHCRW